MKKYIMPEMDVVRMDSADVIATSAGVSFGDGDTGIMHSHESDFELFDSFE